MEQEIDDALKKAGGANYDLGNTRTGVQAGSSQALKSSVSKVFLGNFPHSTRSMLALTVVCGFQSAKFFQQKEQETQIKGIVYQKGPLQKGLTHCDLSGRSMVAPAAEAKRNTIGYQGT